MQTSQPLCHAGPGALGREGSGRGATRRQQQAKGHTPPSPQGHRTQPPPNQGFVMPLPPLPQGRQQGFIDPKHQGQPWEFRYSAIYFQAQARFASKRSP